MGVDGPGRAEDAGREATRQSRIAEIAHDLRTPLTVIEVAVRLVRAAECDPDRIKQPAEAILRSAHQAERLIRDLLAASTDGRALRVAPVWTAAGGLLADAKTSGELLASRAGATLHVEDPGPDLPRVWADPDQVARVFWNLIDNAGKFAGTGGHIRIRAVPNGGDVEFQVADTGPGVREEDRMLAFMRAWQGDPADDRGWGLGLWICKQIVDAHQGRIWIANDPEGGARIAFTLPSETAAASPMSCVS